MSKFKKILTNIVTQTMVITLVAVVLTGCGEDSIAKVNGRTVSQQEFDAYLKYRNISVRNDRQRKQVFDSYLQREAMADIIEQQIGKGEDSVVIKAELNELRKEVLISRYFENYLSEAISDQSVNNYYNSHSSNYEEKKVHVAHILIRTTRNMDEVQRQSKLTAIQEAYSKIQAGMPFAEAAERYSEDTVSAKKGGDLGWLKEGSIDKAFSEQAFSLNVEDISEPFETSFGFHILTVLEEPQVIKRPFESVKGEIRYQLRNQYKDAEIKRLLERTEIKK